MKDSLKKVLLKKKKATGGLLFILVAVMTSLTLNCTTALSFMDLAKSMVNNAAYMTTFRMATFLYNERKPSGTYAQVTDEVNKISVVAPKEYSTLLNEAFDGKLIKTGSIYIRWDLKNKTATAVTTEAVPVQTQGLLYKMIGGGTVGNSYNSTKGIGVKPDNDIKVVIE